MMGKKSVANAAKTVYDVYKKSDADNPIKMGNPIIDFAVGQNKYAKAWNVGFAVGKGIFIAEQSLKELQKGRK